MRAIASWSSFGIAEGRAGVAAPLFRAASSIQPIAGSSFRARSESRAAAVHVHVKDARLFPEEMIVERRDLEAVREYQGHHRD